MTQNTVTEKSEDKNQSYFKAVGTTIEGAK